MYISLEGTWLAKLGDGREGKMLLPGTLDENRLGNRDLGAKAWHPDVELGNAGEDFQENAPISTRFTRKYTYEGEARFTRRFHLTLPEERRVFLEAERARVLRLFVDGREVPVWRPASISTPYIFEVTGLLDGDHEITLLSDNSYPGLPHDAIVYSSAATDETQTNWNGILGYLRLRVEERVFLSSLAVYPSEGKIRAEAHISSLEPWKGTLVLRSEALARETSVSVETEAAGQPGQEKDPAAETGILTDCTCRVVLEDLAVAEGAKCWDIAEGEDDEAPCLYEMQAVLYEENAGSAAGDGSPGGVLEKPADTGSGQKSFFEKRDEKKVTFGIRTFGDNGSGRLALNGRTIFLRSEANCAEFPETGHPPMTVEEWEDILGRYRSYGVNCVRFHSHCPPEAAFAAADRSGMLMQPELSHWNPRDAFESEESWRYYRTELEQIVRMLANHPSFVMLTFGNELHAGEAGHRRMDELLAFAHSLDSTRLFANGSNVHYGWAGCDSNSDFYTATGCREADLRGTFAEMKGYINKSYPGAAANFDKSMEIIRREFSKPVFSFEVGQFEVLPDFRELSAFKGISDPANLRLIQEKAEKLGLDAVWEQYVEATGELARIGYREEVEAAMRTKELSGISLLGLQDFPGQGTALVGMMNSHLEPKPYDFARPERFREFFRDSLPLLLLERYTYEAGEAICADILVANFGKRNIEGEVRYTLYRGQEVTESREKTAVKEGSRGRAVCPAGCHTLAGRVEIPLDFGSGYFLLRIRVGEIENVYPVWVYPAVRPVCPEGVYETEVFDERTLSVLKEGGRVYLAPKSDKEHLPRSIQAQFTTDFWSVGTFSGQEGGMGQLIDAEHPVFAGFPTKKHTDWQWWAMASQRAVILPRPMKCIITEMDSYAYMRPMAQLLEFRCGLGKVLLSAMGLQDLQQYPEARALQASVYAYLASEDFVPDQEMEPEEVAALVQDGRQTEETQQ